MVIQSIPPQIHDDFDQLLTQPQTAAFLGYTGKALERWRLEGRGPRFIRVSKRSIRYRKRDLLQWMDENTRQSTSQA